MEQLGETHAENNINQISEDKPQTGLGISQRMDRGDSRAGEFRSVYHSGDGEDDMTTEPPTKGSQLAAAVGE
jgi:hypothetical protein